MKPLTQSRVLEGKRAIVTGCSRGLGAAIVEAMWGEGADLLLVARSEAKLNTLRNQLIAAATGTQRAQVLRADLSEAAAPRAILAEARRLWDCVDIVVNNAGIIGPIGLLPDNDWDEWRQAVQVNLLSPAELCKLSIDWMREAGGGGSIVNLSGGGATSPRPRFSAYATTKCALVRFSETIALEVAGLGIRVNCIAPGVLNTEMLQQILRAGADQAGHEEYDRMTKSATGGASDLRLASELVVYLASEKSLGVTGKLISALWDPWRLMHEHLEDLRTTDIYTLRRIVPVDRGKVWANA